MCPDFLLQNKIYQLTTFSYIFDVMLVISTCASCLELQISGTRCQAKAMTFGNRDLSNYALLRVNSDEETSWENGIDVIDVIENVEVTDPPNWQC